jgi:hypothetical protein
LLALSASGYLGWMAPALKTQENSAPASTSTRRRSMRVLLSIGVQVSGKTVTKEDFTEDTRTLVVNAHGALISLSTAVAAGQFVKLTHCATRETRDCRIVYLGNPTGGKVQMGIEFLEASGAFWHIDFPPDDWVVPES